MQELPIGIQSFEILRERNYLYIDKTEKLLELIKKGERYFLSRPRRFGKSLALSTLGAMFSGKVNLFNKLAAEQWVAEQSKNPSPVISIDMSGFDEPKNCEELNQSLITELEYIAEDNDLEIPASNQCGKTLKNIIRALYKKSGYVVVLIDEYDNPILNHISNLNKAEEMREVLRSFYKILKSCDKYLRFVMLTGISKFSKMGIFSAMNNLEDISMDRRYGDIVGYTQQELEFFFEDRITDASEQMNISREELFSRLKDYYDGFSFDGITRLYNPFSILQCLKKASLSNYWYESGSPSFIVKWMKDHQIQDPEDYRHIKVNSDFISAQEIEQADAPSFLYQTGYLTIERREEQLLTLDYPNKEVMNSLSSMYLKLIYKVDGYAMLGNEIWKSLREGNITEIVRLYNIALAGIPYDDYIKNRNEFWYRSLFIMLLRGAGIISYSEPHTSKGRSDVVIQINSLVVILEFKFAEKSSEVEKMKIEGKQQLLNREYAKGYNAEGRKIVTAVIVADDEKRQAVI